MTEGGPAGVDALSELHATIARKDEELERLRQLQSGQQFAGELRRILVLATTAGTIAAPVSHNRLLELIVETAADVISAHAASLFLIDAKNRELVFEVAVGEKAAEIVKYRVPIGHGIAGLVALSGQAMAVSDAEHDPRQAADISQKIGYFPKSLLCVPLFYADQIIGVIELLDKNGGDPFTPRDMDLLAKFAHLAGVAIEQSRRQQSLPVLIEQIVRTIDGISVEQREKLLRDAHAFALHIEEADLTYDQALEIARLVHSIVTHGGKAAQAVQTILRGFVDYLEAQPQFALLGPDH